MPMVVAKDKITYADKSYDAGKPFEVTEDDAEILIGSGTCALAPKSQPRRSSQPKQNTYGRRDLLAEGSQD